MSRLLLLTGILATFILAACSGEKSDVTSEGTGADNSCQKGYCATDKPSNLTAEDVKLILMQAKGEADARNVDATIAVVDRVGNVLAVYRTGSPVPVLIASEPNIDGQTSRVSGGLEGIYLPNQNTTPVDLTAIYIDVQAAIAKAITGAYFSSEGNALSTRVASQVIQDHFNPREFNQPAGPLFGVQISQLACSDFNWDVRDPSRSEGPKKSPLGFAADPGGLPLYKNGQPVGSIGVFADGIYSLDKDITDNEINIDELIATAGTWGFAAPIDIRADRIAVDGKVLNFSNVTFSDLQSDFRNPPAWDASGLEDVTGYYVEADIVDTVDPSLGGNFGDDGVRNGSTFGDANSGIRQAGPLGPFAGLDAFIFVEDTGADPADGLQGVNRFPPIAGTDGGLTQTETETILQEALKIANKTRRQVGRPLGGSARVNITMVDSLGEIIGMVRTRDAIVDGADVTVQKARTAAFFSSDHAADFINNLPDAQYLTTNDTSVGIPLNSSSLGDYIPDTQSFTGISDLFSTGEFAFSQRAAGLLAFPTYPDGIEDVAPGPLSKPKGEWSIFNLGLQLDVSYNSILQHVLFTAGAIGADVAEGCTGVDIAPNLSSISAPASEKYIANGLQTFAGAIPIYKGNTLVGGIGVSGDGNDQADMIAFLGVHNAGIKLGSVNNAPVSMRADVLSPKGIRLRYIQCPFAPFINSDEQNVCGGL